MNWISNKPFPKGRSIDPDYDDQCEHVEADHSVAHWIFCEDDSHGPVARNVVCKECKESILEAEAESLDQCYDCKQEFPMKQLNEWKGFYFSRSEGDEPLLICDSCCELPTHKARIEQYKIDMHNELDDDDDDRNDEMWEAIDDCASYEDEYPDEDEEGEQDDEPPLDSEDQDNPEEEVPS